MESPVRMFVAHHEEQLAYERKMRGCYGADRESSGEAEGQWWPKVVTSKFLVICS